MILSITLISHLPALNSLIQKLRGRFPTLKILAGGAALLRLQAKEVIQELVDGIPSSFEECHKILKRLV